MHIGIDPDLNGALVALSDLPGLEPIAILRMPTMQVEGKPQMNTRAIVQWILDNYAKDDTHVWLEKCPKYATRLATMRSQGIQYGRFIGIFEARFPHMIVHRVRCGQELAGWQRQMLGTFTAETSKERALEVAKEIWPDMAWPADKHGKPRPGVIDAALIAEWGRRQVEKDRPAKAPTVTAPAENIFSIQDDPDFEVQEQMQA